MLLGGSGPWRSTSGSAITGLRSFTGKRRGATLKRNTTGNSSPLAACTVIICTTTAISPGMISTPAHTEAYGNVALKEAREAMIPSARIGSGEDIADVAVFLASDASRYINGANIPVDGGVTRALLGLMPMPAGNGEIKTTLEQHNLR